MSSRLARLAAIALGLALLVVTRVWTVAGLLDAPLHAYGMEWFLKLGPGEGAYLARYAALGALGVCALAWGLSPLAARAMRRSLSPRMVMGFAVVIGVVLVGVVRFVVLDCEVVTDDERVYTFQAAMLASGHAALPAPPMPEFYTNVFVDTVGGNWLGQYPPGHPIVLAPAQRFGGLDLVPLFLAAVNLLLTGLLVRDLVGPRAAAWATVLLAVSPLFVFTGATLLSHGTAYAALTLALWGAVRWRDQRKLPWAILAGGGWALLMLTRPYTAVTLGLFPVGILIVDAARTRTWRGLVGAGVPAALGLAGLLLYNALATGHPFLTGYGALRRAGAIEFGFGTIVAGYHDHTPLQGLKNVGVLALRYAFWLVGGPWILLALVLPWLRRNPNSAASRRWHTIQITAWAMLGLGLLAYVPYWAIGVNDTGPVKTYELLLPGVVLLSLALETWRTRWMDRGWPLAGVVGTLLAAAVVFWPPQISHCEEIVQHVREPLDLVASEVELPALVFVVNVQPPVGRTWVYGRPNPRVDLSDPILYVRDQGPKNLAFWRLHQDRTPDRLEYRDERFVVLPLRVMRR